MYCLFSHCSTSAMKFYSNLLLMFFIYNLFSTTFFRSTIKFFSTFFSTISYSDLQSTCSWVCCYVHTKTHLQTCAQKANLRTQALVQLLSNQIAQLKRRISAFDNASRKWWISPAGSDLRASLYWHVMTRYIAVWCSVNCETCFLYRDSISKTIWIP